MAPLIMLVISLWLVRVPFAYSMLDRWHADAIWWSFPIASLISVTMSSGYYRYGSWRKVRLGVADARPAPVAGSVVAVAAAPVAAAPVAAASVGVASVGVARSTPSI
jgi:hypothetical protein